MADFLPHIHLLDRSNIRSNNKWSDHSYCSYECRIRTIRTVDVLLCSVSLQLPIWFYQVLSLPIALPLGQS